MSCCAPSLWRPGLPRAPDLTSCWPHCTGVRVLERSIRAFANCREVSEIVVVCPEERFHAIDAADLEAGIPITRVDGGAERHESVQNGLAALLYTPELVAVTTVRAPSSPSSKSPAASRQPGNVERQPPPAPSRTR